MKLDQQFKDFLTSIRLSARQREDYQKGIRTLRERLAADQKISPLVVSTFLQGSIRRATAVKPKGDKRADADLVVVTNIDRAPPGSARDTLKKFADFADRWYPGKWKLQGRSIGIELSYVEMDIVPTALPDDGDALQKLRWSSVTATEDIEEAYDWRLSKGWVSPSERHLKPRTFMESAEAVAEWRSEPLWIPDRDANCWERTHPLAQIKWTVDKNRDCNGHYVNIVKTVKWLRLNDPQMPKYPKGYPVEHLVGVCCPDGVGSVAEGLTLTLEKIASAYVGHVARGLTPFLPDHGVPTHDVMARVSPEDFKKFHARICEAAAVARDALDCDDATQSAELWRRLLGGSFPMPPVNGGDRGGFTTRATVSEVGGRDPRFA